MASDARYQSELDAGPEEWKSSLKFGPPDQAEQDQGPPEDALSLEEEEAAKEPAAQGNSNDNQTGEDDARAEKLAALQKSKFEEEREQMRSELVQHMKSRYLDGHEDDAGVNYAQIDEDSDWDDDEFVAERHHDAEEAYFDDT